MGKMPHGQNASWTKCLKTKCLTVKMADLHANIDSTIVILNPEIKNRIESKDESVPFRMGSFFYQQKFEAESEYFDLWRYPVGQENQQEKIIDGRTLGAQSDYFQLGGWQISKDESHLAYAVDRIGRRNYTIFIKDLSSGQVIETEIKDCESWSFEIWKRN